jgi:hypothetical protein
MSGALRVGVVGGGLIAQAIHLPRLVRLGELFEFAAIADPSETVREALCHRYPSARASSPPVGMPDVDTGVRLTRGRGGLGPPPRPRRGGLGLQPVAARAPR